MARPWLRHPPRTIRPPLACPSGEPRFASEELAWSALGSAMADARLTPAACDACRGGWHHQPA